jgi:hypothetical protein
LGIAIFFGGCQEKVPEEPIVKDSTYKTIDIEYPKKIEFNDFVKNIEYVVLEPKQGYLISKIDKIMVKDSMIFILDKWQKSIFIFDHTGKPKHKIADFGEGPGQYSGISDFDISGGFLFLLTGPPKEMSLYDLSGNYIQSIPTGGKFLSHFVKQGSTWVSHLNGSYNEEYKSNIMIWDSLFTTRKKEFLYIESEKRNIGARMPNFLTRNRDEVFLYENLSNLIYKLEDGNLSVVNEILINGEGIPKKEYIKILNSSQEEQIKVFEMDFFIGMRRILATDKFLFIQIMKGKGLINCFISHNSHDFLAYSEEFHGWGISLPGEIIGVSQDQFIYEVTDKIMIQLKELQESGKLTTDNFKNKQIYQAIDQYEKEGNPVLMFFDVDLSGVQQD